MEPIDTIKCEHCENDYPFNEVFPDAGDSGAMLCTDCIKGLSKTELVPSGEPSGCQSYCQTGCQSYCQTGCQVSHQAN